MQILLSVSKCKTKAFLPFLKGTEYNLCRDGFTLTKYSLRKLQTYNILNKKHNI